VELTAPEAAALRVLRERARVHTRALLGLPAGEGQGRFAELDDGDVATCLGRIVAEQMQLAVLRRGAWSDAQIDAALGEAMLAAVAETLEILHDSGHLDEVTWRVLGTALHEWGTRLARVVAPDGGTEGVASG